MKEILMLHASLTNKAEDETQSTINEPKVTKSVKQPSMVKNTPKNNHLRLKNNPGK